MKVSSEKQHADRCISSLLAVKVPDLPQMEIVKPADHVMFNL
jgi:hypothetical protein